MLLGKVEKCEGIFMDNQLKKEANVIRMTLSKWLKAMNSKTLYCQSGNI